MSENGKKEGSPETQEQSKDPHATRDPYDESYFIGSNQSGRKKKKLPPWLDHFNEKDLKMLFKASLAVWITTIFIFIDKTLKFLGQASFFGCIVLFIVPPSGVVFIHVLAGLMIIVGLALGWAWGTITMKAALATRPAAEVAARYRELQLSAPQNTTNTAPGQTTYAQIAIFDGFMLDTRVTVTYFCMFGLFVYLVARLRVVTPKLTLVAIFAMVIADVYLTSAPLIPTFQGTIPLSMIYPVAVAVGVGMVCNLLIFPQSTSHIVIDGMKDVLIPMEGFVKALSWHFRNSDSRFDRERLQRLKGELLAAYGNLDSSNKFLPMDFSYGKWSPEDITSLQEPFRQVYVAFGELLQLAISREEGNIKNESLTKALKTIDDREKESRPPVGYHQIVRAVDLRTFGKHPDTDEMIIKTLEALSSNTSPLFMAWQQAYDVAIQAMKTSHTKQTAERLKSHQDALDSLRKIQAEFESSAGHSLLSPYSHLFDTEGNFVFDENPEHPPPVYGLLIGLLYQERMINLSKTITTLLEKVIEIEEKRLKSRLWLPKGLQRIFAWGLSQEEAPSTGQITLSLQRTMTGGLQQQKKKKQLFKRKAKDTVETKDTDTAASRLEVLRTPTGRQRHKPSTVLLVLINWFTGDEGLYALRTLIVTIALSIPAVIPSSAGFYYREKGMWALVMGQFALVPYASDFVSGLIVRTAGTVFGGILGLICWYIGAGSGPGNAFGLSAVMAVAIVVMMWWRLFAPPEHMPAGIMLTSTMYMVVAYGWIDTHLPSYGNPGVGYTVFWRRLLLVLIGFGAAVVVVFFPRPPSGNKHYRQLLSQQISTVKDRYALFASTWRSPPSDLAEVIEKEAIQSEELLTSLVQPIKDTKYEFSTSNFDAETLGRACQLCSNMNQYMTQLLLYTQKLPLPLRERFIRSHGPVDENVVADLMAVLTLVQLSLESGNPLPAVLPTPLLARTMAAGRRTAGSSNSGDHAINLAKEFEQEGGRQFVSAVHAFVRLLGTVDDLVVVVKLAVGEGANVDLSALNAERV